MISSAGSGMVAPSFGDWILRPGGSRRQRGMPGGLALDRPPRRGRMRSDASPSGVSFTEGSMRANALPCVAAGLFLSAGAVLAGAGPPPEASRVAGLIRQLGDD